VDTIVVADQLGLPGEAAVAELQLQVLAAWTAEMHKDHVAHQQQQELPAAAGKSSSKQHSSRHAQQQQQLQQPRQPAKQQWRADLLSIPALHQDMLPLLPGGQVYLDAAESATSGWGATGEDRATHIHDLANSCCCTLLAHMQQQQLGSSAASVLVSAAAVRLLLELQLLAAGAAQRQWQRQYQVPQLLQQQPTSTSRRRNIATVLLQNCRRVLALLIRALAVSARSCLPPEVLQQAGLQLLQALAAPMQQLQLRAPGDAFYDDAAAVEGMTAFKEALYVLVTAACGAEQLEGERGEHRYRQPCTYSAT
jgi:hypothetical protein